jgi:predicted dienelactone hydrolase
MKIKFRAIFLLIAILAFACASCGDDDSSSNDFEYELQADDDDDSDDDDPDPPVNPFLNPQRFGPYRVGNTSFILEDTQRLLSCGTGNRRLVVEAWYPAADDADQLPENEIFDFFLTQRDEAVAIYIDHEHFKSEADNFPTGSFRDAPINPDAPLMPLLVFSHGFSGERFQNFNMANYLASHGYLVVSADHTCNALASCFPDGIVDFTILNLPLTLGERIGDIQFLITQFTQNTPEIFEGRVDSDRVAIFGHSFGGITVTETIKQEPRAKAMLQLAALGLPNVPNTVTAPSMYMSGQQDKWMGPFMFLHDGNIANMPAPKWELEFYDTGHFAFSDYCIYSHKIGDGGDGCGQGTRRGSGEPFANPTPDHMRSMIFPYAVAFFGAILFEEETLWDYLDENHNPDWMLYTQTLE